MVKLTVEVECEREEGLNVGKEVLAEEIGDQLNGQWFSVDTTEFGMTVTEVSYEGSKRGEPMRFSIQVELDTELVEETGIDEGISGSMCQMIEDVQLDVEAPNDTDSQYSVISVEVTGIDRPEE